MSDFPRKVFAPLALVAAVAAGSATALLPATPAWAQAGAAARALPDFTDLVEQVGPSVVNIRTVEKVTARTGGGNGMDEEMLEFFRRFGVPVPNAPRQQRPQPRQRAPASARRGLGAALVD